MKYSEINYDLFHHLVVPSHSIGNELDIYIHKGDTLKSKGMSESPFNTYLVTYYSGLHGTDYIVVKSYEDEIFNVLTITNIDNCLQYASFKHTFKSYRIFSNQFDINYDRDIFMFNAGITVNLHSLCFRAYLIINGYKDEETYPESFDYSAYKFEPVKPDKGVNNG